MSWKKSCFRVFSIFFFLLVSPFCIHSEFSEWFSKLRLFILILASLGKHSRIHLSVFYIRGESHIHFRTHCIIMTKKHDSSTPCYLCHFQIFDKTDSFPKHFLKCLCDKKGKLNL